MSFEATISRKKALDAATRAVDLANELTAKHNETIEEVAKTRNGLAGLREEVFKRLNAQLEMIGTAEKSTQQLGVRVTRERGDLDEHIAREIKKLDELWAQALKDESDARLEQIVELVRIVEAHQQMRFLDRLRWLFTGRVPAVAPAYDIETDTFGAVDTQHN